MTVMQDLFQTGDYRHILLNIFSNLDGSGLSIASAVCPLWQQFIHSYIWNNKRLIKRLERRWHGHLPQIATKIHGKRLISTRCDEWRLAGVDQHVGDIVVYSRTDLSQQGGGNKGLKDNNDPVSSPIISLHHSESKFVCFDFYVDCLITVNCKGELEEWNLTGDEATFVDCIGKEMYAISKLMLSDEGLTLYLANGNDVVVFRRPALKARFKLREILCGHTDNIACLAAVFGSDSFSFASGSADKSIRIWPVRPGDKTLTLLGHRSRILCVAAFNDYCASGSKDRTCRVWDLRNGACVRILEQETFVYSVAIDGHRLVTGDFAGYVHVWSLENCANVSNCGPADLCLRAHNAVDSARPLHSKAVTFLRLEAAVLVAVAGENGRITVQDFWDHGGSDYLRLESFAKKPQTS